MSLLRPTLRLALRSGSRFQSTSVAAPAISKEAAKAIPFSSPSDAWPVKKTVQSKPTGFIDGLLNPPNKIIDKQLAYQKSGLPPHMYGKYNTLYLTFYTALHYTSMVIAVYCAGCLFAGHKLIQWDKEGKIHFTITNDQATEFKSAQ